MFNRLHVVFYFLVSIVDPSIGSRLRWTSNEESFIPGIFQFSVSRIEPIKSE
jgi:hypothetical protein